MFVGGADNLYKHIFNSIDELIFVSNKEGKIIEVNEKVVESLGFERDDITGKSLNEIFEGKDVLKLVLNRNEDKGYEKQLLEIICRTKDGKELECELYAKEIEIGEDKHIILTLRDITQKKKIESILKQREEIIKRGQKLEAIGRLAGGIAHDFNNILTAIIGYVDIILIKGDINPASSQYLLEIKKSAERASNLVAQLLAFSRRQILEPKIVNLNAIVTGLLGMIKRLIGEDIELVTVLDYGLGNVKVDPVQFEQVIVNLVVNARDAMPDGGKLIIETKNVVLDEEYCKYHHPVNPGDYVLFVVSDTGIGMDEETIKHIFEPFFTTKGEGEGTGLGLSTVYGIVKQSNGYIWVYSEVGVGTTFKIYLPRVMEEAEAKERETDSVLREVRGSGTILVVEDDHSVRSMIEEVLSGLGYRVVTAENGAEAVETVKNIGPCIDLLITDVVLPKMNGLEVYRRIREINNNLKVLFVSGYTNRAIIHTGILSDGFPFLQKPFTPQMLAIKIKEVLGG